MHDESLGFIHPDLKVRYAQTDDEVIAIHGFLCMVAGPSLPALIDAKDSIEEIWRLVHEDCAMMAMRGDHCIGTLGIANQKAWWGDYRFLANRWFFCLPGLGAGRLLLREGLGIAKASELELHILDEKRARYVILNRNPKRDQENPFLFPGQPVNVTAAERPPTIQ